MVKMVRAHLKAWAILPFWTRSEVDAVAVAVEDAVDEDFACSAMRVVRDTDGATVGLKVARRWRGKAVAGSETKKSNGKMNVDNCTILEVVRDITGSG